MRRLPKPSMAACLTFIMTRSPSGWWASRTRSGGDSTSGMEMLCRSARVAERESSSGQSTTENGSMSGTWVISHWNRLSRRREVALRALAIGWQASASVRAEWRRASSSRPSTLTSSCTLQGSTSLSRR